MPIYKQTTEITNIDDLLSSVERDIEEVYFGDKQVFTVWATYDGTLPAQYSANGSTLADYRVYGSAGGVGDRTENIFDMRESSQGYGYQSDSIMIPGGVALTQSFFISEYIPVKAGTTYEYFTDIFASSQAAYKFYKIEGKTVEFISQVQQKSVMNRVGYSPSACSSFTVPISATHMRINVQKNSQMFMIVQGSTAPAEYIPYGYELDMSVSDDTTSTATPIFIGDTPLGDGEYVDYGEQKVYRMSGGVLTPTDPPVPLPELPTVDGTNIVDYAGQSAAPTEFYAKYRKQNF